MTIGILDRKSDMRRNYTIDYVRLLAAFGVISLHLAPSSLIAAQMTAYFDLSVVPFFLIVSLYLFQSGGSRFEKIGFARILIPYISWSAIYFVAKTVKYLAIGTSIDYDWLSILCFGGAGVQLYFLPLLLCGLIIAAAVKTLFVNRDGKTSNKLLSLFAIVLLIIISDLLRGSNYQGFNGNFFDKLLYYVLFSQAINILLPQLLKFRKIVLGLSFVSILLLVRVSVEHLANVSLMSIFLAASILIVCLMYPIDRVPKFTSSVLSTTYGIYLCHHLFVEILEFVMNRLSIGYSPYSIPTKLTCSFIVLVISIIFVLSIRKWKVISFLLLGETKSTKIREING